MVAATGERDIFAPCLKLSAALVERNSFVVRDVIDLAAKRVKRGHATAFFGRKKNESEREVGGAFSRDRFADLCVNGGHN